MQHFIAYDVACPRRLQKVHRYLSQQAIPLQNSVFLHIGNREQARQCFVALTKMLHPKQDNLRFYRLPNHAQIHAMGKRALPMGIVLQGLSA